MEALEDRYVFQIHNGNEWIDLTKPMPKSAMEQNITSYLLTWEDGRVVRWVGQVVDIETGAFDMKNERITVQIRVEGDTTPWEEIPALQSRNVFETWMIADSHCYDLFLQYDNIQEIRWAWVGSTQGHYIYGPAVPVPGGE